MYTNGGAQDLTSPLTTTVSLRRTWESENLGAALSQAPVTSRRHRLTPSRSDDRYQARPHAAHEQLRRPDKTNSADRKRATRTTLCKATPPTTNEQLRRPDAKQLRRPQTSNSDDPAQSNSDDRKRATPTTGRKATPTTANEQLRRPDAKQLRRPQTSNSDDPAQSPTRVVKGRRDNVFFVW